MTSEEQFTLLNWLQENKTLILSDIIRGRGHFTAEWILVAVKLQTETKWCLKNVNEALQHYSQGNVEISPRGSIKIGRVLMQRKGGDKGRNTSKMLQFKLDPTELLNLQ